MINNIIISRIQRIVKADIFRPKKCYSKWWYADVTEKCTSKDTCKYIKFTKNDWIKYSNKYFRDNPIK